MLDFSACHVSLANKNHILKFQHPTGSSKPHPPRHLANLLELRVNISQVLVPSSTNIHRPKINMPPQKKGPFHKKKRHFIFQALFFSGKSSKTFSGLKKTQPIAPNESQSLPWRCHPTTTGDVTFYCSPLKWSSLPSLKLTFT